MDIQLRGIEQDKVMIDADKNWTTFRKKRPSKFRQKCKSLKGFSEIHSSLFNQDRTLFLVACDKAIQALFEWVIKFLVYFKRSGLSLLQT